MIWEQTVDKGVYRCRVERIDDYHGRLIVVEASSEKVLLDKPVGLSYGARFGPDTGDVDDWQRQSITAIEAHEKGQE
jgi:hypothetical protein